jgi:TonB family protein
MRYCEGYEPDQRAIDLDQDVMTIRMISLGSALFILALVLPLCARGDCSHDAAQIKLALPPEALSIRNALFSRLCERSNGELLDITDPTVAGRLTAPSGMTFISDRSGNPGEFRGNLVLAFLVDLDGTFRDTTIIISSGNKKLDEQTLKTWPCCKYKTPAMLDGRPVRVLMYFKFKATNSGWPP